MWDAISAVMNSFNDFLWGWFMIILLLGTHIFLTIRTKFVQRKTFKAIKLSVTKDPDSDGDISPFQALATALASTIGTGNIIRRYCDCTRRPRCGSLVLAHRCFRYRNEVFRVTHRCKVSCKDL